MGFAVPTILLTGSSTKNATVTIRPDGAGCSTELTPSAGNNWECVDEITQDGDTSYVETHATFSNLDLYATPDQTHTGTITSLKICSYSKSHLNSPSIAAEFYLSLSTNSCVTVSNSSNFTLTTEYAKYDYSWFTNPNTGLAWTWDEMDDLQIGIQCSSPSLFDVPTNVIFRPNDDGTYQNLINYFHIGEPHYKWVDEEVAKEDDVWYDFIDDKTNTINTWHYDTYTMPSHTTETGTINYVTVFVRCKIGTGGSSYTAKTRAALYTGGSLFTGDIYNLSRSYADYSTTWINNPDTSATWTWSDIDNLEIGVGLFANYALLYRRVTQVWCVVNYDKVYVNPEIRTTQVYAEIRSVSTPTCSLPKPIDIQVNQQIDTTGLNFWSGNRDVYAQGRSGKKTILTGLMWDGCTDGVTSCEDLIACVRALGKTQNKITISGLRYTDLNTDYNITSFGWKRISEKPNVYEWQLDLEFTD